MQFIRDEDPIDGLLAQHRTVLEYEHFVETRSWTEVETEFPGGPPVCECVICRQLEAFSDKVVTIMRELRSQENAPQHNEPRMETLMSDLIAFSGASEPTGLDGARQARKMRSWGG